MVREDLITSAVSFLQDPSVAGAPLEKRIAFLQSKNLTQEEVDLSLARAAEDPSQPSSSPPSTPTPASYARPPPPAPAYGNYPPQSYWQPPPPPPPEPPKRDWRDYFIMATVMGGVSYGLYFTAKRYIMPLIQPPTQPQLEQDKASVDESFKRAFDLLEQLNTDTAALKASEEARTTRLDTALGEVEGVLASLKESTKKQGDDNRRIEDDVRGLRDLIPKALDAQKESTDNRLKELSTELKSLKTLIGNRMGSGTARPPSITPSYSYGAGQSQSAAPTTNISSTSMPQSTSILSPQPSSTTTISEQTNGASATEAQASSNSTTSAPATSSAPAASEKPVPGLFSRPTASRAAIPAWQMAAQKKNEEAKKDTSESGTAVDASQSA